MHAEPRDQFLPIVWELFYTMSGKKKKKIQVMYAHQHTIPSVAANVDHRDTVLFQFNTRFYARHRDAKRTIQPPPSESLQAS